MVQRFTIVELEYQNDSFFGVQKDNYLYVSSPTRNYGLSDDVHVQDKTADARNTIMQIRMPGDADVNGFDDIIKVEIGLYLNAQTTGNPLDIGCIKIEDDWVEGTGGAAGTAPMESNWDDAKPAVPWNAGGGAVVTDDGGIDDGEQVIDSQSVAVALNTWHWWDITQEFTKDDYKTLVFVVLNGANFMSFFSKDNTVDTTKNPILKITYRSYPPEGFKDEAAKLRIIPNELNPEQPKLTWGGVDADDFTQYKLYRDTNPITSIDGFDSAITAVSIASDYFEIDGDHQAAFPVGSTFKVSGYPGNDGRWTVSAVSLVSGDTRIEVDEDVTDATVDGDIHHGIYTTLDSAIEEYIDESTLVDGTTYYYRLIAEDEDNHEDAALTSATVSFTKPAITTADLDNTTQNVGAQNEIDIVSPQNIKRVYVDWDDGSTSWYEFEVVGTTKSVQHIYSKHSGAGVFTPDIRIEDEFGFWSGLDACDNTVDVNDTTPVAKLLVNVQKAVVGDDITLNGSVSQPAGSNTTIAKYEFKRHENDSWQDNGTDPIYTFASTGAGFSGAITEFADMGGGQVRVSSVSHGLTNGDYVEITGTTNYDGVYLIANVLVGSFRITHTYDGDDATGTWKRNGTVQAQMRITTDAASGALQDTDTVEYEFEASEPTEITPGVEDGLSIETKIHELPHTLGRSKLVEAPIETDGTEYEFDMGRRAERFTIHATTHYPAMEDDITIIRNAWLNNTYLRLTQTSEMETKTIQYDFKLDGDVEIGQNHDNMINWSFPVRVLVRTEVAKPKVKGDITAWADGGGGKVQATSTAHGLVVGQTVLITGTVNYNGTYVITNVTTNTFKFVATWSVDDAMGLWRKVGVS